MTIVVEFTLPAESFPFGRATNGDPDALVRLERVVPVGTDRIPYLWVTDGRPDRFERHLRDSEIVDGVERSARVDESVRYAVEWSTDGETLFDGIAEARGALVSGRKDGDGDWSFTVRFPDQDDLSRFHRFYREREFPLRVERIYPLGDESSSEFGLTPKQRETLLLGLERGYFSVPRGITLESLGEELGITRQAASERIRRGVATGLSEGLVDPLVRDGGDGRNGTDPSDS